MTDSDPDRRHEIALFRYGLIADLVRLESGSKGLYAQIEQKAAGEYAIPGSTRTRVAGETIRDWLKAYRRGGFDALLPKPRADRGQSRSLPPQVADVLLEIKEGNPALSVQLVVREARTREEVPEDLPLPLSTVHRLLARHGLMDKPRGEDTDTDRRRFAFARAGELWMSDVMHGPSVVVGDRTKRKTYLIAFIDDATRVIPYAAFALAESTRAFLPVLKQAVQRRGLPARLYVDNGANYRSQHLALVCAKLGIALIHARPYRPQGKGKIERWFKTVRGQLLTRLNDEDTASLAALNRRLHVWVESEYHHAPHRGLGGVTPLEQWAQTGEAVRFPEPEVDLDDLFLFEAQRKVQKDRTVSLNGVVYEVDAALVGEKITLRFDPAAAPERPVQVYHQGKLIEQARPVETYANCFVKRNRPSWTLNVDGPAPEPSGAGLKLRALPNEGEEER
ncbi:MAG: DDE-type integrase/transposase/recombinase [Pseudomonadota bacterium]|nr:DDE-type integrase/transposase/recombinase [Pseudomonadota bacterium]